MTFVPADGRAGSCPSDGAYSAKPPQGLAAESPGIMPAPPSGPRNEPRGSILPMELTIQRAMGDSPDKPESAPDVAETLAAARNLVSAPARARSVSREVARLNREAVELMLDAREEPVDMRRAEKYRQAETRLRDAEQLDDGHPVTCTNWGALFLETEFCTRTGRTGTTWAARWAQAVLARAIHRGSSDANTYFNMAVALIRLEKLDDVFELLDEARALDADPETLATVVDADEIPSADEQPEPEKEPSVEPVDIEQLAVKHDTESKVDSADLESLDEIQVVDWVLDYMDDYDGQKPVAAFVDRLIIAGQRLQAVCCAIEPLKTGFRVGLMTHAALGEYWMYPSKWVFPTEDHKAVVSRLMISAHLEVTKRDVAQEGRYSLDTPLGHVTLQVSTHPTIHGEKVVMRYV